MAGSRSSESEALTIYELKKKSGVTDEQLNQPIPQHRLFDIAKLIPNWYDYSGAAGLELNRGERLSIQTSAILYDNSLKAQEALEIWYRRNPYNATYMCILTMCLHRQHGDIAMKIVDIIQGDLPCNVAESALSNEADVQLEMQGFYEYIDSDIPIHPSKKFDESNLETKSRILMKKEFSGLYTSLRLAMHKKEVQGSDLLSHLKDMEMFGLETESIYSYEQLTLGRAISTLKSTPSLDTIFHLMAPYCSWFNYLLLESIIDVFFSDDDNHFIHKKLISFKQKFCEYCKDRYDLVNEDFAPESIGRTSCAVFKIDHHWDNIRIEHLPAIIEALADALRVRKQNLILRTVNNGCLELNIAMSEQRAEELFPLQDKLLPALRDCKVLKYEQPPWFCNIDKALKGIEESRRAASRIQVRLRLLRPGPLPIAAHPEAPLNRLLPLATPTPNEQILERLRSKAIVIEDSPGALTGLMLARVGEQAQSDLISVPEISPLGKVFLTLELMGYYIAGGTSPRHSFLLGLAVLLWSSAVRYKSWKLYPHNRAVRLTIIAEICESIGIFTGSVVASMFCQAHGFVLGKSNKVPFVLALFFAGGTTLGKFVGMYLKHKYATKKM